MTLADGAHGGHPFVVAHRGASADRPEHTLAAYELALREGADGVECDVRLTRDGHLVCVHDRRVDRTSTGTGLVSDMTLAQLKELDWGAWHSSWRPWACAPACCYRSRLSRARWCNSISSMEGSMRSSVFKTERAC